MTKDFLCRKVRIVNSFFNPSPSEGIYRRNIVGINSEVSVIDRKVLVRGIINRLGISRQTDRKTFCYIDVEGVANGVFAHISNCRNREGEFTSTDLDVTVELCVKTVDVGSGYAADGRWKVIEKEVPLEDPGVDNDFGPRQNSLVLDPRDRVPDSAHIFAPESEAPALTQMFEPMRETPDDSGEAGYPVPIYSPDIAPVKWYQRWPLNWLTCIPRFLWRQISQ